MKKFIICIISLLLFVLMGTLCFAGEIGQTKEGIRVDFLYSDDEHTTPVLDENGLQCLRVIGYIGTDKNITIPETVDMYGDGNEYPVVEISAYAFAQNTILKSVKIGDNITYIGEGAFKGCNRMTKVVLGKGITEIPDSCFAECTLLKNIEIPQSVTKIGTYAFENCTHLRSLKIPSSVSEIGIFAFNACENLVLDTTENAYAEQYASENNLFTDFKSSPDYPLYVTLSITAVLLIILAVIKIIVTHLKAKKEQ